MTRKFTPQGFEDFATLVDSHGSNVVVRESSEAGAMHCWIFCHVGDEGERMNTTPHLTAAQARVVARGLLAFAKRARKEDGE
jgi:hypothetical protein